MLEVIKGTKLIEIECVFDYIQFFFSDKSILSIYNRYQASGEMKDYINKNIVNIEETEDCIRIDFEKNGSVLIDLRDEAFKSPEALELLTKDGQIIVWN